VQSTRLACPRPWNQSQIIKTGEMGDKFTLSLETTKIKKQTKNQKPNKTQTKYNYFLRHW
jgi:hypothetical protein